MKRLIIGFAATIGVLALVAVGLAAFRPELLPAWARINSAQAEDYGLYCKEHGVPEKFCTLCHPELKEKLLLCPEHGNIPEDICTKCHPENQRKYDIKVCEHGLPEHFCPKCHPPTEGGSASAESAHLVNDGWCQEFGERTPDGKLVYCKLLPMVRLASADLGQQIGLKAAPVGEEAHAHELVTNAATAFDANRYAEITPRVTGFLREARLDLGQKVKAGEVLAIVDSAEVSTAKTQYIAGKDAVRLAEDIYGRISKLLSTNAIAAKEGPVALSALNQARASMLSAEQRLRNFRFDDDALAEILKKNDTKPLLEIVSPIEGTVVYRHAVQGEAIDPSVKLYTIADTAMIWLWIDVYEQDIDQIQLGQPVTFAVSGNVTASNRQAQSHSGNVTWIGSEVDEITRTTKVRAELPNPNGKLRAHQFGRARIQIGERHEALTVPKSAVQRYENVDLVFLPQKGSEYRPQRIKTRPLGRSDTLEVTWGLKPGQQVVSAGAFLLKTEIMKGSIGAGCCD
ncbi:efflux RND transporter periplasmic adaptor subunit [Singulisphaera sp. Ch08]|uniref:Efflux RND transporter periplasmic adaptor subunit n=1 Tax=Singulisphaera sp. Ch08 TaxID=3120278 RepID=A0AAU7CBQ7_9BACT